MPAVDELAKVESDIEIIWRAFELRPEPIPLPDATSERFKKMWENSIYPLAEKIGVEMKMPTVKPYSRKTHEAAKWADSIGAFDEFKNEIFRTYFQRDENIGEVETLLSIAKKLNLETESLQNALETNKYLKEVLSDERDANGLGINGVPAFVADRKSGFSGLQTVENLLLLINSVKD